MADSNQVRGCLEVDEVLSFLDGVLTAEERRPLEAHLAGCSSCRALVSELARPGDTTAGSLAKTDAEGTPSASEPEPLLPGERLGRYEILRPLGAGTMGQVFLATDPELRRAVAIKCLRDAEGYAPFLEREAQALARLRHPNVVAVYDVGGAGSRRFVALEYVQGQTLTEWLRTPRSVRQILDVFRQAGEGLGAAHLAGMVHRDFKPDNVLVGDDGVAKVSDFGLARAQGTSGQRATGVLSVDLSSHIQLIGTPLYMAPEVFLGKPANAKSDQFAFCVSLWEALAGETPFGGRDLPSLRAAVLEGAPRALPSSHRIPGWLEPILRRGLSRRPERRFPSMAALLRAMEQARSRSEQPRRWIVWALLAAVVASAVAFGLSALGVCAPLEARAQGRVLVATQRPWSELVKWVLIDESTLKRGRGAALRSELTRVVAALEAAGAKAIVLGGSLQGAATGLAEGDRGLARALRSGAPVVVGTGCSGEASDSPARAQVETLAHGPTPAKPCAHLALPSRSLAPETLAQTETARSASGVLEGVYGLVSADGLRVPSLAIAAYARANGFAIEQRGDRLVVGPSELFVDRGGVVRASFRMPQMEQLQSLSDLDAALSAEASGRFPKWLARKFEGRYVLIGSNAEGSHEVGVFADGQPAPMALLQGQLLSDLIESQPVRAMGPGLLWLLVLAFAALTAVGATALPLRWTAAALVGPWLVQVGLWLLFARAGLIGSPVLTALASGLAFALALSLRLALRERGRHRLGAALHAQVQGAGGSGPRAIAAISPDGARKHGTVLVARHAKALRADGAPEAALAHTREVLERASHAVWEHNGRVESARVDPLMAVFESGGRAQHAQAASRAAHRLAAEGWACAVATAELVVGELGLPGAPHYGVIGPAVAEALSLLPRARRGEVLFNDEARARSGIKKAISAEGARGRRAS